MAWAIVQKPGAYSAANATTVAVTLSSTSAGNLLVVGTYNSNTATVSSIVDNIGTNVYVQATSALGTNSNRKTDVWHVLSTSAGVTTITVTFSGAAGTYDKCVWAYEISGVAAPVFDLANNSTGNSSGNAVPGGSVTTTGTTGFILGVAFCNGGVVASPAAGNEFTSGSTTVDSYSSCSLLSSTAAAHAPAWTNNSDGAYVTSTSAYKESPVAAAGLPQIGVSVWG